MRLSLRAKFFGPILGLVLVGMTVLVFMNDRTVKNAFFHVESDTMSLLCQALGRDVGDNVAGNQTLLASLAKFPGVVAVVSGGAPEAANTILTTMVKGLSGVDYANVFDAAGLCMASSNPAAVGKIKVPDRDYFKAIMAGGKDKVVSKALVSRTTGKAVVVLAQAVKDASGKTVGVANMGMDLESLTRGLAATKIGKTGYAFILDGDGMVLAHPDG